MRGKLHSAERGSLPAGEAHDFIQLLRLIFRSGLLFCQGRGQHYFGLRRWDPEGVDEVVSVH